MSESAIYRGTIRHRRFADAEHAFEHDVALAWIDLDELPALLGGSLVSRRPGLVRFRREDYLGDPTQPLADSVRDLVSERSGTRPAGPVRVLTNLRSLGQCFNPVSFYYCYDAPGERVEAVVAEVTNTPWGERHSYVLVRAERSGPVLAGSFDKELHVSPFMGMDHRYLWRLAEPAETLSVHIESLRGGKLAFDATLSLRRRELTTRALAGATSRVLALIYGHALRLKLKGASVYPHPQRSAA
jgi:DUF1365 family protein